MSKIYNSVNCEKEVLGEVFELPKEKVRSPWELIQDADNLVFNQITNK